MRYGGGILGNKYVKDFSREDAYIMNDLRSVGESYLQIAKRYECSRTTIRNVLKREGLYKYQPAYSKRIFTKQEKLDIIRKWLIGSSVRALTTEYNTSDGEINRVLERAGVKTERGKEIRKEAKRYLMGKPTTKKVHKKKPRKIRIKPFPCPFQSCNDRMECKDIEQPQECILWQFWFTNDGELKRSDSETREAILPPKY